MLSGVKKTKQYGAIQPKIIFVGLGVVIVLLVGFNYFQSKARTERIQALQQKTQETNAANAAIQAINTNDTTSISNSDNQSKQPEMAERPPSVDLSEIRMQVEKLSSLYNKFVTVLSNGSNSSERLSNLQAIQSELASVSVDSCLSEAKSNLQRGMQERIDGAYDSDFISTAYDQMNHCQNQ